jgi:hypothetical protein
MITKRNFSYLMALGVLSCLGCKSQRPHSRGRDSKKFKKIQFPYGVSFCGSLLPDYDFKQRNIESLEIGRDRNESKDITIDYKNISSFRKSLDEIDQIRSLAIIKSLDEKDHETISSIAKEIDLQKYGANLRFSINGPVLSRKIISIDLIGMRKPDCKFSFSQGEVNPRLKMEAVLSPRVFELLSRIQLKRAFFNYSRCELSHFLGWSEKGARVANTIECIGLPSSLSVSEVRLALDSIAPPILDLSGYEDDLILLESLVSLAGEFGVKWVIISDYVDFDWDFLIKKLEERSAESPCVNAVIGYNTIAVLNE